MDIVKSGELLKFCQSISMNKGEFDAVELFYFNRNGDFAFPARSVRCVRKSRYEIRWNFPTYEDYVNERRKASERAVFHLNNSKFNYTLR